MGVAGNVLGIMSKFAMALDLVPGVGSILSGLMNMGSRGLQWLDVRAQTVTE